MNRELNIFQFKETNDLYRIFGNFCNLYNVWRNNEISGYVGFCDNKNNIYIDDNKLNDVIGFYISSDYNAKENIDKISNLYPLIEWYTNNLYNGNNKDKLQKYLNRNIRCSIRRMTFITKWFIFCDMMEYVYGFIKYFDDINGLNFDYSRYEELLNSSNWIKEGYSFYDIIEILISVYLGCNDNISISNRILNYDNSYKELYKGKLVKEFDENGFIEIRNNDIKVCLCVIVCQENLYLREFVEYYKSIGIDKIVIYDNNLKTGENPKLVINDYIIDGFVDYVNIRKDSNIQLSEFDILQTNTYTNCFEKYKNDYDWICFFDVDEFLDNELRTFNLKEYLSFNCFDDYDMIQIGWSIYDDNKNYFYEDKHLYDRFTHSKGIDWTSKVIIRCDITYKINFINPHVVDYIRKGCNCVGEKSCEGELNYDNTFCKWQNYEVFIKHYLTKSTSEFLYNKVSKFNTRGLSKEYYYYFNDSTPLKDKILDSEIY